MDGGRIWSARRHLSGREASAKRAGPGLLDAWDFFLSRKTKLPLNQRLQGDPQRPN